MSNHVALTDDERKDVVAFYGDYFRAAGEGRQPTAFQLDAINDPDVRDAFLFWQLSANPVDYNSNFQDRTEVLALTELFGANPTGFQAIKALTRLIKDNTDRGVEVEDIDTGSVWTLAHLMWLLLGGAWHEAVDEAQLLSDLVKRANKVLPDNVYPHGEPLMGLGQATALLALLKVAQGEEFALNASADMYGFTPDHPSTRWARSAYQSKRKESNNAA